jgi:ATP phosphoribosyltransferase regulatory subunit
MSSEPLKALRARFEAFGGVWTDAPTLQPLGLLLDLAGEAVRSRLFVVSGGPQEMALRPDFTIGVTRAHIADGAAAGRYLYEGAAFRAPLSPDEDETEFLQIGVEMFGEGDDPPAEDAAIVRLAVEAVASGGRKDLKLVLGDVGLFRAFLGAVGVSDGARARLMDVFANPTALRSELHKAEGLSGAPQEGGLADLLADLPEAEGAKVLEELWAVAGIQPVGGRSASEIVHRLALRASTKRSGALEPQEAALVRAFLEVSGPPHLALAEVEKIAASAGGDLSQAAAAWTRRLSALSGDFGVETVFSTGFARPFSYYDGFLFEVLSEALGEHAPLAAGGRYDALPERLGGRRGAVGCMVRPARALMAPVRFGGLT